MNHPNGLLSTLKLFQQDIPRRRLRDTVVHRYGKLLSAPLWPLPASGETAGDAQPNPASTWFSPSMAARISEPVESVVPSLFL